MVVLTILVMCSALIPLSISRLLPGRRVAVTAERIKTAVMETQAQSVAVGQPLRVTVGEHAVIIGSLRTSVASQGEARILKLPTSTDVRMQFSDGQPQQSMIVYPDGATTGGQFEVMEGRRRLSVSVSALTGRVVIEDGL